VRLGFPEKILGEGGFAERDGRRWQNEPHLRRSIELVHPIVDYLERHDLRFTGSPRRWPRTRRTRR
jgi:UV DNA damage endonuclease